MLKHTISFVAVVGLVFALAVASTASAATIIVGNDLSAPVPGGGDGGSDGALMVMGYYPATPTSDFVIPSNGILTAMTILEDTDTTAEPADLLVLRQTAVNTYLVIQRATVTDDAVPATTGTTTYPLANLAVQAGDIIGHTTMGGGVGGPIPTITDNINGPGELELVYDTTVVGGTINFTPFGGGKVAARDYFYNVTLIPEPSTFVLAALGLLSLGFVTWRRRRRS